ncbi:unnamed protein product, partial [Effrenium voratum]
DGGGWSHQCGGGRAELPQGIIHSQMDAKACKIDGEALLIEDDKQMAPEGDILMFRMIMIYITTKTDLWKRLKQTENLREWTFFGRETLEAL